MHHGLAAPAEGEVNCYREGLPHGGGMSSKSVAADAPTHPLDRASVADVVRRIQRGERLEEGYKRLFREYEPALRKFFLSKGWPEAEVDDLVQDVMLRVYRGIGSFRSESTFHTWILQIMVNVWKNALREKDTNKPEANWISLDDAVKHDEDSGPVLPEPIDSGSDPFERAFAAECRQRLREALDELPSRMRQCLLLRSQGYKDREIAEILGVSVHTVKKQIQRSLKRLQSLDPRVELFSLLVLLILLLP